MTDAATDTRKTHSLTDFLRNSEAHIARLKQTRTPEVLTVNGRAEVVILDAETYDGLVGQLNHQREKEIAAARAHMAQVRKAAPPQEPVTEAEMESRQAAMRELVAETERLGLYR